MQSIRRGIKIPVTAYGLGKRSESTKKISVDLLPDPPYVIPRSDRFRAESAGTYSKKWLSDVPQFREVIRNSVYFPSKERLWNASIHESLTRYARSNPYHDVLRVVMEHGYFFLFYELLHSRDAPLPHVIYEDFMKCKTFASLQNPPEEQFALDADLVRAILCTAAHHCVSDHAYFTTCETLFRKMEQEQSMTKEMLSSWVFCCVAAGQVEKAVSYAKWMKNHHMPFDDVVFSLLLHPSFSASTGKNEAAILQQSQGLLLQQRLSGRLQTAYEADSVVVHAMFVFYSLTFHHIKKWETFRSAIENKVPLSERTMQYAMEVFAQEKGYRCGPLTNKAIVSALAERGTAGQLLFALMRMRRNETLPQLAQLPRTAFDEEEVAYVMATLHQRATEDKKMRAILSYVEPALTQNSPNENGLKSGEGLANTRVGTARDDGNMRKLKPFPSPARTETTDENASETNLSEPEKRQSDSAVDISHGESRPQPLGPESSISLQEAQALVLQEVKALDRLTTVKHALGKSNIEQHQKQQQDHETEEGSVRDSGVGASQSVNVLPSCTALEGNDTAAAFEFTSSKSWGLRQVILDAEAQASEIEDAYKRLRTSWIHPGSV